jgi:cardiolipin synthase A/B
MMVEVHGHAASYLQAAFAQLWAESCGEILVGPAFYPHDREIESELPEIARHVNVISSPAHEAHPLRKVFWLSFRCARERIYVASSYFVPDDHLRDILKQQAAAGVDVRVLAPNELTDAKPVRWAGQSYYDDLLQAGIRIFEYQGSFMHSKYLVVDGAWAVVGSANLDVRSKELNQENVIGILDPPFAQNLEATFLEDLRRAEEIELDAWRRRGLWPRVRERLSVLFAEQY